MMRSQSTTRLIFMGTPEFAVPCLNALCQAGDAHHWEVIAVVTQPDRPAGRSRKPVSSPVKDYAVNANVPVLQPHRLRRQPEAVEALRSLASDLIVVAAFGQILPPNVLEIPQFGCVNVHASLLPAYRGASPITAALLNGDEETGVTIMLMDEGMDTGPALAQARQPIHVDDTAASLAGRLAEQGAALLVETLPRWLVGTVPPVPQDALAGEPSLCYPIRKEDGKIDWQQPAVVIERIVRAYTPWPSAFTTWKGEHFKIRQATAAPGQAAPGTVVWTPDGPAVGSGAGLLLLKQVQPAGRKAMDVQSFLNGAPDFVGSRLGEEG